jgi:hypothetical protein
MIDGRGLLLALCAAVALATASEAQRFDPRSNFNDSGERREERDESRRLSHDQLRAIVQRQFPVREMRTSGECGGEFWALIIDTEGRRSWVILDVSDGRHLRTRSDAPPCG